MEYILSGEFSKRRFGIDGNNFSFWDVHIETT